MGFRRRRAPRLGDTEAVDARRLADAERDAGDVPAGCAWLDERTVEDVDLSLVFRTVNRTVTPTGAQALWRWLAAPARVPDVLEAREQAIATLAADPARREAIRDALKGFSTSDAPHLPRLLWEPAPEAARVGRFVAMAGALVALGVLGIVWSPLWLAAIALFAVNVLVNEREGERTAHQGHALAVLCQTLGAAERLATRGAWRDDAIAREVSSFAGLRKRVAWLTASDPFGIADAVRAGLHARTLLLRGSLRRVEAERARLRRIVLWLGEVDAATAIADLRGVRDDARVPTLTAGARTIEADGLVHPAIDGAIGNDVTIDAGLLVTGSNMSGKSTFLRALAVNAICAQSIHTTFGAWRGGLVRVFAVMRVTDATEAGVSLYGAQVAAIGRLVDAVSDGDDDLPALFVVDEPFNGTNPALRVPIVVSVLDYCAHRDVVIAATHDLDVARQVDARFVRVHFAEADDERGTFDRKLRAGISPSTNALSLLVRAGYPAAIIAAVEGRTRA